MGDFTKFIFNQTEVETLIVCGHSYWFREFFRCHLPHSIEHNAKSKKVINCGVVTFEMLHVPGVGMENQYVIDPNTIEAVYEGFES